MNPDAPQRGPFFTIGHSTRPAGDLMDLLRAAGVPLLVDVRRFPASRRHPQFAREALARALEEAGIAYRHEPDLGGRRQPLPLSPDGGLGAQPRSGVSPQGPRAGIHSRASSPNGAWRNEGFRGYADHMASPEFAAALERLLRSPAGTAILCAEAVPWRCHRQLIADALVARGAGVLHILGPRRHEPHALHADARVASDGSLTYPPRGQRALFGGEPDH